VGRPAEVHQMIKLIPEWVYWIAIGVLILAVGGQQVRVANAHTELATEKTERAEETQKLTQAALGQSEANRKKEQAQAAKLRKAQDDYAKLQKTNADSARDLGRVRGDFQTALNSRCTNNPTAPGCVDGAGKLERELLGSCAQALGELAAEADGATAKVVGLQAYIKSITKD